MVFVGFIYLYRVYIRILLGLESDFASWRFVVLSLPMDVKAHLEQPEALPPMKSDNQPQARLEAPNHTSNR